MELSDRDILRIARQHVPPEQLARSRLFRRASPLRHDDEIRLGPERLRMPFDGTVVFVDLAPDANWAHPCLYLLCETNGEQVRVIQASFPPSDASASSTSYVQVPMDS